MLTLSRGDDSLVVAPGHGGAIVGWTRGGTHMFRRPSPQAVLLGQPGAMGCFPLVPFCNRIANRRFDWAGQSHELTPNFGDHPHAIHGVGWQRPWQVEEASATAITLSLRHDAADESAHAWPFAFSAQIIYSLTEQGLTIEIAATNLHPAPAPMGLGVHPYFPRAPGATIAFQADGVWMNDPDMLPATHEPIPAAWDHTRGRAVDSERLDNCFTGWRGEATLPGLRIVANPILANLQVFTPTGADFFCVEPVSHVPDAINRPGLPNARAMTVLARGETLNGSIAFFPGGGASAANTGSAA